MASSACAPDERHDSNFYKICKDKNKSEDLAHTVRELLALVSAPSSCEQAHNYLMKTSSLSLEGKDIKALEPLAGLPKLVELNLAGNQISDLSKLNDLPKLKFLYLERNQLSSVEPLAALPSLQVLNVSHNKLSQLAEFAKLAKLQRLYATHNELSYSQDSFSQDSFSQDSFSQGSDSSAVSFPAVVKLNLSDNAQLSALPAQLVAAVTELNISATAIAELSALKDNTSLVGIVADNNGNLADLSPLQNKPGLAVVSVKSNKVSDIGVLASAQGLRHLDITYNQVTSLMPLAASANLKALFVEGNPIANSKNQTKENCPQGPDVPEPVNTICQQF